VQPIADPKGNPIGLNARSDTDLENIKMLNIFVKRKRFVDSNNKKLLV